MPQHLLGAGVSSGIDAAEKKEQQSKMRRNLPTIQLVHVSLFPQGQSHSLNLWLPFFLSLLPLSVLLLPTFAESTVHTSLFT